MAWFARIDNPPSATRETVVQTVNYYDDAVLDKDGLPTLVWSETFSFPLGSQKSDLQAKTVAAGQSARKAQQVAAALLASTPIGTTILIP